MSRIDENRRPGIRIGILGGGQLASMLADASRRAGLRVLVMAASADEPAAAAGHEAMIGDQDDALQLDRFLEQIDILTIENEFLDLPRIDAALEKRPTAVLRPGRRAIAVAQDKLAQKRLFRQLEIPTADFEILQPAQLAEEIPRLQELFPDGFVLKWSRFGYDGRGNLAVKGDESPDLDEISRFCQAGDEAGAMIYAERMIDFAAELAMVSARGLDRSQVFLPMVITRQENGVCREVQGPATAFGVDAEQESEARKILTMLGAELEFCGAFAVEFFVSREGRILVNEMAPRVHNSGHYSLWPGEMSQFDLHLQAITGAALRTSDDGGIVLMRNVLGPRSLEAATLCAAPTEAPPAGVGLHWYGKKLAAPGRKMGHLTARAKGMEAAMQIAAAMTEWEARFWARHGNEHKSEGENEQRHEHEERGARRHHHGVGVGSPGHERRIGDPR